MAQGQPVGRPVTINHAQGPLAVDIGWYRRRGKEEGRKEKVQREEHSNGGQKEKAKLKRGRNKKSKPFSKAEEQLMTQILQPLNAVKSVTLVSSRFPATW